jgi:hypothetical protein
VAAAAFTSSAAFLQRFVACRDGTRLARGGAMIPSSLAPRARVFRLLAVLTSPPVFLGCGGGAAVDPPSAPSADEGGEGGEAPIAFPRVSGSRDGAPTGLDVVLPWFASVRFVKQGSFSETSMGVVGYVGRPLESGACLTGNGRLGVREDDCCVWRADAAPPLAPGPSLGRVTVENVSRGDARSEESPPVAPLPWVPWSSDDVVELRTAGGSLPPFTVRSVAPAFFEPLTAEARSALTVSRARGVKRTFAPSPLGRVELALFGPGVMIECRAPAAAGAVAVPGPLVARVLGDAPAVTVVLFTRVTSETVAADRGEATLELATQLVEAVDAPIVP